MKPLSAKSPIRNLEALEAEISRLKLHVREEEALLVKKTGQIPLELLKKAGLGIVEVIAGRQGVSGITQLLQAGYYWLKGKKQKEDTSDLTKEKLTGGLLISGSPGSFIY
ncbi:MAG: hypothetical protein ACK46Z_04060 [Bacteroidota bacterium]